MAQDRIGGYRYAFLDAPYKDDYCAMCDLPAKEPHQGKCDCGHVYCKSCLEEKKMFDQVICKSCGEPLDVYLDYHSARRIKSLRVKCPSVGCAWTEELEKLKDHLDQCRFVLTPCSNESGESVISSHHEEGYNFSQTLREPSAEVSKNFKVVGTLKINEEDNVQQQPTTVEHSDLFDEITILPPSSDTIQTLSRQSIVEAEYDVQPSFSEEEAVFSPQKSVSSPSHHSIAKNNWQSDFPSSIPNEEVVHSTNSDTFLRTAEGVNRLTENNGKRASITNSLHDNIIFPSRKSILQSNENDRSGSNQGYDTDENTQFYPIDKAAVLSSDSYNHQNNAKETGELNRGRENYETEETDASNRTAIYLQDNRTTQINTNKKDDSTEGFGVKKFEMLCQSNSSSKIALLHQPVANENDDLSQGYSNHETKKSYPFRQVIILSSDDSNSQGAVCQSDSQKQKRTERKVLISHHNDFSDDVANCPYKDLGCKSTSTQETLAEHKTELLELHLDLFVGKQKEYTSQLDLYWKHLVIPDHKTEHTMLAAHIKMIEAVHSSIVFKMTSFQKYKERKKSKNSTGFYTHINGYKMCLCVYANGIGEGEGTHISVCVRRMKGVYDDNLDWPVKFNLTVGVLNQLRDSSHHIYSEIKSPGDHLPALKRDSQAKRWGIPKLIAHDQLRFQAAKQCQYLLDDCIYFKVKVEVLPDCKPWLITSPL